MVSARSPWGIAGGLLAAFGASLCCAGPLVLLMLGISGSWISNLTVLEPYRPIFIVLVAGLFGWSGWQLYRPQKACTPGTPCALPATRQRQRRLFWLAGLTALAFISSPYWLVYFA